MSTRWRLPFPGHARRKEDGYVAILTVLLFTTLFGMCAFAVDVGNWYYTGQRAQRAADAAALAGVPKLPSDQAGAFAEAQIYAKANGFDNASSTVSVVPSIDGQPTRLRVTTSMTVQNQFGILFGLGHTTISRTAVADYAGPVPMGSPCNEFGNDPESTGIKSTNCADAGMFWANVGAPKAPKKSGDAYQNGDCSSGEDGCGSGGANAEYDTNGYFYQITVTKPVQNLTLQAFDPALIAVGDLCTLNSLSSAKALPAAKTAPVTDPATRYADGQSSPFCTGDVRFGGTGEVSTKFTVRDPGPNPWDPLSFPPRTSCPAITYPGYNGDLSKALDNSKSQYNDIAPGYVAGVFRQWKTLCTIPYAAPGVYMIQVQTNGTGADLASGHNRFGLRAFSTTDSTARDAIAIAGYNKMAMYANSPAANTKFFLTQVPPGAAGQVLNVRLFDVGDSTLPGVITVLPPPDSGITNFAGCKGFGPTGGTSGQALVNCAIPANSSYNGKWEQIAVPIPSNYTCDNTVTTGCWLRLSYDYGTGNQPTDTTSWTASLEGDPVRLVE